MPVQLLHRDGEGTQRLREGSAACEPGGRQSVGLPLAVLSGEG
jgi:hypothetical protein